MNLADLQIFKSVVEEGGVNRAASKLHRVPSAVITRIKQLEASMGVQLSHGASLHHSSRWQEADHAAL